MSDLNLADFLKARLDEDEVASTAAGQLSGRWFIDVEGNVQDEDTGGGGNAYVAVGPWDGAVDEADAAHIARHDPARVLREAAMWRRILLESQTKGLDAKYKGTERETGFHLALSFVLKAKAATYDDHPDYPPDGIWDD